MLGQVLLDRYRVDAPLGQGGLGTVYVGTDLKTQRKVAAKIIAPPEDMEPQDAQTLIEREIRALMMLDHPNVLRLLDWARLADGSYAVITELLEGRDLEAIVAEQGPLPELAALALADGALAALDVAHQKRIAHRDIKPANLFVCNTGRVVLIDFGIAKGIEGGSSKTLARSANTGIVGTPHFLAPELLTGASYSTESDVYAFGGTMFFAINGEPPFDGDSLVDVLDAIARSKRAEMAHPPSAPLRAWIDACMAYRPPDRPKDAAAARAALQPMIKRAQGVHDALIRYARNERTTIVQQTTITGSDATTLSQTALSQTAIATVTSKVGRDDAGGNATAIATAKGVAPRKRVPVAAIAAASTLVLIFLLVGARFVLAPSPAPKVVVAQPQVPTEPAPVDHPASLPVPDSPPVVAKPVETPAPRGTGSVKIVLKQWADVTVDGAAKGRKQNAVRFDLAEGPHTLTVSNPEFGERDMRFRIRAKEETTVTVDFAR